MIRSFGQPGQRNQRNNFFLLFSEEKIELKFIKNSKKETSKSTKCLCRTN